MYHDSIDKYHPPRQFIRQTELYSKTVLPVKKRNNIYLRRNQDYLNLIGIFIKAIVEVIPDRK